MALSKEEAGDLQSFVTRMMNTHKSLLDAEAAHSEACYNYNQFLYRLQKPPKDAAQKPLAPETATL